MTSLSKREDETRAMARASAGIAAQAAGDPGGAAQHWRQALADAEAHLPESNIVPWIRSGLADALLRSGDPRGAITAASAALAFCNSVRAPLAALTLARSHLMLGEVEEGRRYAREACALHGEAVLKAFTNAEREALGRV